MAGLSAEQAEAAAGQFPLSPVQELWLSGDEGDHSGFFSECFTMATAVRISGHVDVRALQGALDDVVARHEALRTVVVRDAQPPYQQVHQPCPVPLQVRTARPAAGQTPDALAEELLGEAEQWTVSPRKVPVLRAALNRLDDADSVLTLVVHHTACDEWSIQVILRDLAACYRARLADRPPALPETVQYREFTAWQLARLSRPAAADARAYWQERTRGARLFAAPTARPAPDVHTIPCSAVHFAIDAATTAAAARLGRDCGGSTATTLLAAFSVFAHRIAGATDLTLDTLTTGRGDVRFRDAVGSLMNFLLLRTDLATAESFRDVVTRVLDTCTEAAAREIPIQEVVEELLESADWASTTNCIVGIFEKPFATTALQFSDGCYEVYKRPQFVPSGAWIPHGVAWNAHLLASGEVTGSVQFNIEEIDETTVAEWISTFQRILSDGTSEPDRAWKTLAAASY